MSAPLPAFERGHSDYREISRSEPHTVGPNGAGKSTLLETVAGDLPPSAGSVTLDGRPAGEWTPVEAAMRRAVLLQRTSIAFPFAVADVVRMGRSPWAGTDLEDEDEARVGEALRAADVADLADRPFTTLSGGERARVAFARVLAQATSLLLLDEPTAALDIRHQERLLGLARERASAGGAVVMAIHELGSAAAYADRLVLVDGGRVVAAGPPAQVLVAELLERVYRWPVDVLANPRTGTPIVVPRR